MRLASTIDLARRAGRLERPDQRVDPVGDDHRHAGERQFQGHRARGGERRMGAAEGRELLLFALDDARPHRPVRGALAGSRPPGAAPPAARPRPARTRSLTSATVSPNGRISRAISLRRLPGSTSSTGRRAFASGGRSPGAGRSAVEPLDERMADIGAGRAAEVAVHRRLERQDREDMVDEAAPSAAPGRAARAQTAGRDIVDDRDRRIAAGARALPTRRLKPGMSMRTSTSGIGAITAAAVRRMRADEMRQARRSPP